MKPRLRTAGFITLLLAAPYSGAHHSFSAFDLSKAVELKGTVKEFHWVNPHSWVVVETTDASGKSVDATLEANGPGYLVRYGWKRDILNPGDKVTFVVHPLRDGSPGGSLMRAVLPSGTVLNAEVMGPPVGGPPGGAPPAGYGPPPADNKGAANAK